ncbi:hypothetical protein [Streptomyces sp. NPDC059874]|uniref:hypothetical protein n=1 Tax=Streptomyces sp. NPDC059874 TaxID=3346983 RepID=UPI0036561214
MVAGNFKPPALTSRAQRAAEDLAERVDYWRTAQTLIESRDWPEVVPDDVLELARFLAKDTD